MSMFWAQQKFFKVSSFVLTEIKESHTGLEQHDGE